MYLTNIDVSDISSIYSKSKVTKINNRDTTYVKIKSNTEGDIEFVGYKKYILDNIIQYCNTSNRFLVYLDYLSKYFVFICIR